MKKIILFTLILASILFARQTFAASVSLHTVSEANLGEVVKVSVKLDTDNEAINSIDFSLEYPNDLLSFVGYSEEKSLVKMWVDSPHAVNGKIQMTGIIPGGVSGLYDVNKKELGDLPLVVLLFKTKNKGEVKLHLSKSIVLKNDGLGSSLIHSDSDASFFIKQEALKDTTFVPNDYLLPEAYSDVTPPNSFVIKLIQPALLSNTPQMLFFQASDLDSGIKEYKVKVNSDRWLNVSSPYPISRSIFSRNVYIRAYDFGGNFKESNIYVPGYLPFIYLFVLVLIVALSGFLIRKLLR